MNQQRKKACKSSVLHDLIEADGIALPISRAFTGVLKKLSWNGIQGKRRMAVSLPGKTFLMDGVKLSGKGSYLCPDGV
ncbi:hypothetical protein ES703_39426 [subsurface metagenome]